MLVTPATSRKQTAPPRVVEPTSAVPTSPPVITPAVKHPVYGATPIGRDGFTLQKQPIQTLNFWHKRATEIGKSDDVNAGAARVIAGEIYDVALNYRPSGGRDASEQFQIVLREMRTEDTVTAIGLDEFASMVDGLADATAFIVPAKEPGSSSRGRKLTRAGLLRRYQAFLLGELETVSWHLYGSRDYAMQYCPTDRAVNKRLRVSGPKGRSYPFFEEKGLTKRATSVLKSLKIDTVLADRGV